MNCMKCGREIQENQVFCIDCLKDMAKYPVRPGTAVHLPKHMANNGVRRSAPRRRVVSLEEKVKKQRKVIRRLTVALIVVTLLAGLLAYPAISYLTDNQHLIGQNYSVIQELIPTEKEE